ncbi:aquaporin, putative [Eimeria maxima]|uniref:Aquaporin, putative n=1 Tax=Eimeria maxima TaxID=5804 RepID=U6MC97_EIMMA|nr:aquaporin, putative [Eimeria maxima]CDJ61862.1 aquaporin, putative [Eimeria maxima]
MCAVGLIEYHANQEVANERMASSESNGQQGNAPPAPSTVAGQLSSFPAPPGGLSPPVEAEHVSCKADPVPEGAVRVLPRRYRYPPRPTGFRGNIESRSSHTSPVAQGAFLDSGGGTDTRTQRGQSVVSQMFLPVPSSGDGSEFPVAEGPAEDSQEALSKGHVRMLYVIFCAQKFFCELLGTLFLVTSIALAEKGSHAIFAPCSVSAVVYVLTFLFVPISGAHFNPAVSTAMFVTSKHFRAFEYIAYFLCQLIGGTCGALIGWAIMGEPLEVLPLDPGASSARSIFHEVIPTILLIYTCLVLTFATSAGDVSLVTIPLTAAMAVLFGGIAGATMNPAVATEGADVVDIVLREDRFALKNGFIVCI